MNVVKIENVYSWLITEDDDLKHKLWAALRHPQKGYWHSKAYKQKRWDGHIEYFKENSGMFLTGLLPEIFAALKIANQPYEIVDRRSSVPWLYDTIDDQFLNKWLPQGIDPSTKEPYKPITLHDYQIDYVHQSYRFGRGLITAPTGAGKTYILISILKSLPPATPVLFMTKNSGLVNQNYKEMKLWGVKNLGRYYGKYKEPNTVMCCTAHVDTLRSIQDFLPKVKVLIVDEVHECMSDVPVAAYRMMKNASNRFGFSATSFKFDGKDKVQKWAVKGHFGGVFKTKTTETGYLTTKELQNRGILSRSRCTVYPMEEPKNIKHEPYGDAVTLGIANNLFFHNVVKRLAAKLTGRTLILVERIDQGNYLQQLIPNAHWIKGADDIEEREKVFKELKIGENVVCIAMRQIITAGINVYLHNMINAAGGQAEHNIIQQMGRGLRCAPDKECLDFYDFWFKTNDYLDDHSVNRIRVLEKEGHEVTIKEAIDF